MTAVFKFPMDDSDRMDDGAEPPYYDVGLGRRWRIDSGWAADSDPNSMTMCFPVYNRMDDGTRIR